MGRRSSTPENTSSAPKASFGQLMPYLLEHKKVLSFVIVLSVIGAVDVMIDADGQPYVLEINSAPSQTSPYRQECMAKCFDWLIEKGKASIPIIEERGNWKKFIHPALSEEAFV